MGWKSFKAHYNIEQPVHIDGNFLFIKAEQAADLIVIDLRTGTLRAHPRFMDQLSLHYPDLINDSAEKILEAFYQKDIFSADIPVYCFDHERGQVLEYFCEFEGYPNLTHCGKVMYEDSFWPTKNQAVSQGLIRAQASIDFYEGELGALEKKRVRLLHLIGEGKRKKKEISDFYSIDNALIE